MASFDVLAVIGTQVGNCSFPSALIGLRAVIDKTTCAHERPLPAKGEQAQVLTGYPYVFLKSTQVLQFLNLLRPMDAQIFIM